MDLLLQLVLGKQVGDFELAGVFFGQRRGLEREKVGVFRKHLRVENGLLETRHRLDQRLFAGPFELAPFLGPLLYEVLEPAAHRSGRLRVGPQAEGLEVALRGNAAQLQLAHFLLGLELLLGVRLLPQRLGLLDGLHIRKAAARVDFELFLFEGTRQFLFDVFEELYLVGDQPLLLGHRHALTALLPPDRILELSLEKLGLALRLLKELGAPFAF